MLSMADRQSSICRPDALNEKQKAAIYIPNAGRADIRLKNLFGPEI
jgi:hypothetical protein